MAFADYRLCVPLRVRWAEADMQGVVFNGHYLTYCDVAVTEYWRAIGLKYPDELLAGGTDTFVRKATVEYFAAAHYDDELFICARTARLGRSSLRFALELFRQDDPGRALIAAELVYVNADPKAKEPVPWPDRVRELIRRFEPLAPQEAADGAR
ncbi:MAG TPA: thioesterase family protein [Burkholderiaceae bacterium]|nr:thioesterase family protein [Burkholderiaceae bacterium]